MPKKRSGTRAEAATLTLSYDNTTPTPSQQASYEPFRRSSVLSTPHQIVLQLMTRLSRLEEEIMMFLKELARYPEIAAQIEEFRDRVENLYALYYRYYYSFHPVRPFIGIEETDDITTLVPDEVGQFIDELVALEMEWKAFVEENKLWVAFI